MADLGKRCLDVGVGALSESWEYSYAFAEYTSLVVFSYIKKGSAAAATALEPVSKTDALTPVKDAAVAAYNKTVTGLAAASEAIGKAFVCRRKQQTNEKLDSLDTRLTQLEQRLAYLEKHGIIATKEGLQVKGKKLTEDRLMFLRNIVKENIDIMAGDTNGD
ncbi:MAG: hypothetical protein L7F77_07290 [Candidatus Magnetominusculus sp. LBB02]|nr:hypothetical protein [Candidatus Magnetominusculus sp. LBB02]